MSSSSSIVDELDELADDLTISSTPPGSLSPAVSMPGTPVTSGLRIPQRGLSQSTEPAFAHSLPTRAGRLGSISASHSSTNLVDAGGFLDLASSNHLADYFAEASPPTTPAPAAHMQPHLVHSASSSGLGAPHTHAPMPSYPSAPSVPSPADWPRSGTTAIPIHPSSATAARPRANSHATPSMLAAAGMVSGSPTSTILAKPPSPVSSSGRSWSLIEHGRRFLHGGGPASPSPVPAASTPGVGVGSGSRPTEVLGSSWSGGGVTHIQLPQNFSAVTRDGRGRSQSFVAPASSSLTAHVQAHAHPLRVFLSCSSMPPATKANVGRVLEHGRELEKTIEEYKNLLTKLWSRRRQVLGTLHTSLSRLQAWMQVNKLAVLQELVTVQSDLFDKEEAMLRHACILLKESQATMKAGIEEMNETIGQLAHLIETTESRHLLAASQPLLAHFPARDLMALASGPSAKALALQHPLLSGHAGEHKLLSARLEACKIRYLAAAKQTEVEELIPRPTRFKKAVAAMVTAQTRRAETTPSDEPNAQAPATPKLQAAAAASAAVSLPAVLDYAPCRDAELDFARLLLDERSKEGRACAQLLSQLDSLISKKDSPSKPLRTPNGTPVEPLPHPLNALTQANSTESDTAAGGQPNGPSTLVKSASSSSMLDGAAAALNSTSAAGAASPLDLHHSAYATIHSFLHRLESSLLKELSLPAAHRPALRLLIQRTLFPRLWKPMMQLGYEPEDIACLPPLAEGLEKFQHPAEGDEMAAREQALQVQLTWLRKITAVELGVPSIFLPPVPPAAPAAPSTPAHRGSFSNSSTGAAPPTTPGRAPPSHKPNAPSILAATPWQPKPYRQVTDLLEELGGLAAPADMVACLLAASKEIYVAAKKTTDAAQAGRRARGEKEGKQEALGADSFFPLFLFVLIQASVPSWLHRLKLMQRFALTEDQSMAEPAYYLTTLEAALIFIQQATPENVNPNTLAAEPPRKRASETDDTRTPNRATEPPPKGRTTPPPDHLKDAAGDGPTDSGSKEDAHAGSEHATIPTGVLTIPQPIAPAPSKSTAPVAHSAPTNPHGSGSPDADSSSSTSSHTSPALSSSSPAGLPSSMAHPATSLPATGASLAPSTDVIPLQAQRPLTVAVQPESESASEPAAPLTAGSHPLFSGKSKSAPFAADEMAFDANDL